MVFSAVTWAQLDRGSLTTFKVEEIANGIQPDELKNHLSILASDAYEGRETGTPGQKKAAAYIADQFKAYGLPTVGEQNTYYQKIAFISENWKKIELTLNDSTYRHLWDYYAYPSTNMDVENYQFEDFVFLGFGIETDQYNDYDGVDVNGKAILVYDGEPIDKNGKSWITNTTELSEWSTDWRKKVITAKDRGAAAIFIIDRNFKANVAEARKIILNRQLAYGTAEQAEQLYVPNFFITTNLATILLGDQVKKAIRNRKKINKRGKPKKLTFPSNAQTNLEKSVRSLQGENVLGYIEGSDPEVKDELVIVTAHYDHLGKRGNDVYNGADDNGSGTSAVLEVCQAFVEAKEAGIGPRRSVLTMFVSGEEKGLLGSEYYVDHPVYPLDQTVANINVDMVGRVDQKHAEDPNYIYVIGADRLSTTLHDINEAVNDTHTKLTLDYTYNERNDPNRYYYRSDHYNFAERGIPAVFYFNGTHPDYHRISDTVDKINFDKMAKIGQLVFYTAWELANRAERIQVNVKDE